MAKVSAISFRDWSSAVRRHTQLPAFFNWLACWVALPNLPFLPITLMGGPPRYTEIVVCGIVGLVARRLPYGLRAAALLALLTYLVLAFIARMFNMSLGMIASVIGLVLDMRPAVSPEYVAGAGLLVLTCAFALWLLRQRSDFSGSKWLLWAAGIVLCLAGGDYLASRDAMGSYTRLAPAGARFDSASSQVNLLGLADGKTNLMLVVVEAMGQPSSPDLRAKLETIWSRPELADRFTVSHGETLFYGSTTSGEVRELCRRWGNYEDIQRRDETCLPAILAKRGYGTSSYHTFTADFFDRERWYPLIGIQHMAFGPDLLHRGAQLCPNVFPGACDRDVPAIIGKDLAQSKGPQFVYWLTLNSHLPIVENRELGTEHCRELGRRFDDDFPMICRLYSIWDDTAASLARVVSRPDFPPTDILIVGDHMPPFTHQESRLQFDPGHVPWVLLRHKGAQPDASSDRPAK